MFASGVTAPLGDWLRASLGPPCVGGPGVGAIGMCVTGGFASR